MYESEEHDERDTLTRHAPLRREFVDAPGGVAQFILDYPQHSVRKYRNRYDEVKR